MTKQNKTFQLLDIFRGFAALAVVLYHITLETYDKFHFIFLGNFFRLGNIGVDFFFVLSGFIIFFVHNNDAGDQKKIINYFKKRFIRIYPSYWTILLVVLLTYLILQSLIINKADLQFGYLFASFSLFPHVFRLIPPSWTLTEELYFYILFGILLFIPAERLRLGTFTILAIFLFTFSFFIPHTTIIDAIITPYALEFVGGCITGFLFSHFKSHIQKPFFLSLLIAATGLYLTALLQNLSFIRIPLITLSFSMLVWALAKYEVSFAPETNRLLLLIGEASYVIYLIHAFIIKILYKAFFGFHFHNSFILFSLAVMTFLLCIFIPITFHLYYEKPLLKVLRKKLL